MSHDDPPTDTTRSTGAAGVDGTTGGGSNVGSGSGVWSRSLIVLVRYLLGMDYLINGFNWFHKIITPYPSISDFIAFHPPPDVVGAMIDNGLLFHLAKATELLTGLALLGDVFVPLALVLAMPVTIPVFVVDTLSVHPHLRAVLMGTGALTMNLFLLGAYFGHYRQMLAVRGRARLDPRGAECAEIGGGVERIASMLRPLLPVLGAFSAALGVTMIVWLGVMIVQYMIHPLPISAIHPLAPR